MKSKLLYVLLQLAVLVLGRDMDIKIPKVEPETQPERAKTEQAAPEVPSDSNKFEGIQYDRKYMDMYTDEMLWTEEKASHADPLLSLPDGSGSPNHVKYIDYDYYDKYIIDYQTGEWLAGDTIWVIAMTAPVAYSANNSDHVYGLIMRSIRILNDHFYKGQNKIRFGVVNFYVHELIKEALGGRGPCIWLLKDGDAYRHKPMREAFHKVYEFIEHTHIHEPYEKIKAAPRLSTFGLYRTYVTRELRRSQRSLLPFVRQEFGEYMPEQAHELLQAFESSLSIDQQLVATFSILILAMFVIYGTLVYCLKRLIFGRARPRVVPEEEKKKNE